MRVRVSLLVAFVYAGYAAILPPASFAQSTNSPYYCSSQVDSSHEREPGDPPVVVHDIKFEGNMTLPESDLEQFISHVKQENLNGKLGSADEIAEDARGYWQERGYFKVLVDPEAQVFSVDSAGEHIFLTLRINEGPKYWLKEIKFRKDDVEAESEASSPDGRPALRRKNPPPTDETTVVNTNAALAFSKEQLRKLIALRDGDVFSVEKIRDGFDALKKLYGSNGYINFVPTPIIDMDDKQHTVLLTLELYEGKQFRVGKVQTLGADAALNEAVRSVIPSGEVFDNDRWVAGINSISPDFSPARAEMHKDRRAGTLDLIVDFRSCDSASQSAQR